MIIRTNPNKLPNATIPLYSSGSMVQLPTDVTQSYDLQRFLESLQDRLRQLGIWTN